MCIYLYMCHLIQALLILQAAFYLDVFPAIFQWTTSHHFTARLYAQHTVFRMWEDCKSSKVMDVIDKFSVLDNCISFMRRNG